MSDRAVVATTKKSRYILLVILEKIIDVTGKAAKE